MPWNGGDQSLHKKTTADEVLDLLRTAYAHHQSPSAFSEFVRATRRLPIANLDYWERQCSYEAYFATRPRRVLGFNLRSKYEKQVLLPWVDSCSGNGYTRERAVSALKKGAPSSFLFALVLRRLNDWVPEVRAAARKRIPQIANETNPAYVLETLWSVLPHLHTWQRLQSEDKAVIAEIIDKEEMLSRLSEKIIMTTAGPVPAVMSQAGRAPNFDRFWLDISTSAIQPAVRAKAYRSQLDGYVTWIESYQWVWIEESWNRNRHAPTPVLGKRKIQTFRPFLESLKAAATDKSALVRRVAGDALFSHDEGLCDDMVPIAQMLANDPSSSVAERGQFALKRIGK